MFAVRWVQINKCRFYNKRLFVCSNISDVVFPEFTLMSTHDSESGSIKDIEEDLNDEDESTPYLYPL